MIKINLLKNGFLFILLLSTNVFYAQNANSISGKVVNKENETLLGNVLVLNATDSTFIKGTSFIDEPFMLDDIKESKVILKLTSMLFEDTLIKVDFEAHPNIDLLNIIVGSQDHLLEEVLVKGKIALFTQRVDGTVEVNVEKTSLAASSSINEILSRTPGVLSTDDSFQVIGKENIVYYLNEKKITFDQLTMIQTSNIKRIILIRNPSAKYDAAGAAVVKIETLSLSSNGFQSSLKQNITSNVFAGERVFSNANLNFSKNKLSLNANLAFENGDTREILHTTRNREKEAVYLMTDLTTDWDWVINSQFNYHLGLQYDFNENNYFSIAYQGLKEKISLDQNSNNVIKDLVSENYFETDLSGKEFSKDHSLSANYGIKIDTLNSAFFIGAEFATINNERNNDILEKRIEANSLSHRILQSNYKHDIKIISGQIDFTKYFNPNKYLEVGARLGKINNASGLSFLVMDELMGFNLDPSLSNEFNFEEYLGAVYLNYSNVVGDRLNYSIGLRNEYTNYHVDFVNNKTNKLKDDYFTLFPNLSLNFKASEKQTFNFAYTSSIRRPAYHSLNPVLFYQDPYTSIQGNPNLKAQRTHSLEINTAVKGFNIKFGYNHTIDPLGGRALRGEGPYAYVLKPVNYSLKRQGYINLSKEFTKAWFSSSNILNVDYTEIEENSIEVLRITPKPRFYFYSNNTFTIGKLFNLEAMFWYSGDQFEGISHRHKMYNLSFTIEKKLLKDQLSLRFMVTDVFKSSWPSGTYSVGDTAIFYERDRNTNYCRLSFMYKFGTLLNGVVKNKSTSDKEKNRL